MEREQCVDEGCFIFEGHLFLADVWCSACVCACCTKRLPDVLLILGEAPVSDA